MDIARTIEEAMDQNTDLRLVLEIAARAHAYEIQAPPMELTPTSDVAVLPDQMQYTL